jgi:hypothetical protein
MCGRKADRTLHSAFQLGLCVALFFVASCVDGAGTSSSHQSATNEGKSPSARSKLPDDAKLPGNDAEVHGAIAVDGQHIDGGSITFAMTGGGATSWMTPIKDGKYTLPNVKPGPMKVSIRRPVTVGKKKVYDGPDSPLKEILKEGLPARYNEKTELKVDVKPGVNVHNFELLSK